LPGASAPEALRRSSSQTHYVLGLLTLWPFHRFPLPHHLTGISGPIRCQRYQLNPQDRRSAFVSSHRMLWLNRGGNTFYRYPVTSRSKLNKGLVLVIHAPSCHSHILTSCNKLL